MQKFFIAKDGVQKGPWSMEEITHNIHKKVISWNDYIYDEKQNEWLFLFEFAGLTEVFNKSFKNPLQTKPIAPNNYYEERVWYILKQNENYGPFCYLDLVQMLQSKTLFEHDFLWRQGRPAWKRLSEMEEFSGDKLKEVFKHVTEENIDPNRIVFFRRRHVRAKYECQLIVHDQHQVYNAHTVEISAGGASFEIEETSFDIDTQVYLHFKPGVDVPPFNAVCKVVSRSGHVHGVSFVHVPTNVKDSIEKYTKKAA